MGSAEPVPVVRELCAGDSRRWDDFVAGAPHGDVHQGWAWGEYRRWSGRQPVRPALLADRSTEAAAWVQARNGAGLPLPRAPRGPAATAECADLWGSPVAASPVGASRPPLSAHERGAERLP